MKYNISKLTQLLTFLFISILIFPFFSCTKKQDTISDIVWIRYKKNEPKHLVAFTKDGKFLDYSELERNSTYEYRQNRITINYDYGQKEVFYIDKLNDNELLLSEVMEVGEGKTLDLKRPETHEYFLGKWITPEDSKEYLELEFDPDMGGKEEVLVDGYKAKRDFNYQVDDKNLTIDDVKWEYKFDGPYLNLDIKSKDGKKYHLIRK